MRRILVIAGIFLLMLLIAGVVLLGVILTKFNPNKSESELSPIYNSVQNLSFYEFLAQVTGNPKFVEKYFLFDAIRTGYKNVLIDGSTLHRNSDGTFLIGGYHNDTMLIAGRVKELNDGNSVKVTLNDNLYNLEFRNYSLFYESNRPSLPKLLKRNEGLNILKSRMGQLVTFGVYKHKERFILIGIYL